MSIHSGKRVLIFGDSLSHPGSDAGPEVHDYTGPVNSSAPGAVFAGKLLAKGAAATRTNARVSRSAVNFWSREDYQKLLTADAAWKPEVVIVMLGTNDLHINPITDATAMRGIRDAYRQLGADVWAVGPPAFASAEHTRDAETVVATMRDVFGADHFIDARPLSADLTAAGRAGDGVHFTAQGAEVFGDRLASAFAAKSLGLTVGGGLALGLALFFSVLFISVVWTRAR